MTGVRWFLVAVVATVLVLGTLGGCEQVIGLEERVYTEQTPTNQACEDYCDVVLDACQGANSVYSTRETCLGVCAQLDPGDPLEPTTDNTVVCRTRQAHLAQGTEPAVHCPRAGPSGGDYCGTECESYCTLFEQSCPDLAATDCPTKCAALRDGDGFDVTRDHDFDTLECRLVHVSSATVDPDVHCDHAKFASTEWCVDPPDDAPTCADYCRFVSVACTGDNAQYESLEQCLSVCETIPPGRNADQSGDTVACRLWHAHSALLDPDTHCPHAGPTGDGHCGHDADDAAANCVSYCRLAEAACQAEFLATHASEDACVSECSGKPDEFLAVADSLYSVPAAEAASTTTLQCRVLNAARAFADSSHCAAALGQSGCQ